MAARSPVAHGAASLAPGTATTPLRRRSLSLSSSDLPSPRGSMRAFGWDWVNNDTTNSWKAAFSASLLRDGPLTRESVGPLQLPGIELGEAEAKVEMNLWAEMVCYAAKAERQTEWAQIDNDIKKAVWNQCIADDTSLREYDRLLQERHKMEEASRFEFRKQVRRELARELSEAWSVWTKRKYDTTALFASSTLECDATGAGHGGASHAESQHADTVKSEKVPDALAVKPEPKSLLQTMGIPAQSSREVFGGAKAEPAVVATGSMAPQVSVPTARRTTPRPQKHRADGQAAAITKKKARTGGAVEETQAKSEAASQSPIFEQDCQVPETQTQSMPGHDETQDYSGLFAQPVIDVLDD
jgi:hypothetical protein